MKIEIKQDGENIWEYDLDVAEVDELMSKAMQIQTRKIKREENQS